MDKATMYIEMTNHHGDVYSFHVKLIERTKNWSLTCDMPDCEYHGVVNTVAALWAQMDNHSEYGRHEEALLE